MHASWKLKDDLRIWSGLPNFIDQCTTLRTALEVFFAARIVLTLSLASVSHWFPPSCGWRSLQPFHKRQRLISIMFDFFLDTDSWGFSCGELHKHRLIMVPNHLYLCFGCSSESFVLNIFFSISVHLQSIFSRHFQLWYKYHYCMHPA